MEPRTFQDWLHGKYGLFSSDILFLNNEGKNVIIPADMPEVEKRKLREKNLEWIRENEKNLVHDNHLSPEVLECINAEKLKIFNAAVEHKTNELTAYYLSSKKNGNYLQDEIHDVKVILGIREKELLNDIERCVFLNRSSIGFVDLPEIRKYYLSVLKPNKPAQVGFINSPQFPFQDRSKVPYRIMATAFFQYLMWLEGRIKSPKFENKFSNPTIAIAIFLEGEDVSVVGEEWVGKYGSSKNPRSILNDRIHKERDLTVSTVKKRKPCIKIF